MGKILIIDDDAYVCKQLTEFLQKHGFDVLTAYTANKGLKLLKSGDVDFIFCDYRLPDTYGLEAFSHIKRIDSHVPVVFMTAYADVRTAVKLIRRGALDYVTKPLLPEAVLKLVYKGLQDESENKAAFEQQFIAGSSVAMQNVMTHVDLVAPTDLSVLIEGETGTGKEYVARVIHYRSHRQDQPFVALDCGALPGDLANSELFGHVKGAFTGAIQDKKGCFEEAGGGTLFLDEVGNLSHENQARLLRTLQEKMISRLGDSKTVDVDVRIITATNEALQQEVKQLQFREDLYHRLNGFKISIPPLRDRKADIFVFAQRFLENANQEFYKSVAGFDEEVEAIFRRYPWPGNVRELESIVNRCVLLASGSLVTADTLPDEIRRAGVDANEGDEPNKERPVTLKQTAMAAEREAILHALKISGYNKSKAADILEVDRKTLYNKMREYSIRLL